MCLEASGRPCARTELDGGFATLHARVHGQHAVEPEKLCDKLRVLAQYVVVKRT